MAERSVNGDSAEAVAYRLCMDLLPHESAEKRKTSELRKTMLDLFAECLVAAKGNRNYTKSL